MNTPMNNISKFIFWSRWLQAPLYIGLILVLVVYVYQFGLGLLNLVKNANNWHETGIMLQALDLIDVVMLANLIIMVIMGGYETFVSKLNLKGHPDQPEWLDEVNAGTMKVKLALSLIGISSIHLLRTFIDPSLKQNYSVMWQVIIHLTLVVSAIAIAFTNNIMGKGRGHH
ncbi:MAG: TIGR00645 family protein [Gammaproteobacteria bacterium]|nr:TIGR00645 family protein [Gammaproteobacteria bacterium]